MKDAKKMLVNILVSFLILTLHLFIFYPLFVEKEKAISALVYLAVSPHLWCLMGIVALINMIMSLLLKEISYKKKFFVRGIGIFVFLATLFKAGLSLFVHAVVTGVH